MDQAQIKKILNLYGAKAKKSLGQHFLTSLPVVKSMVKAAEIKENSTVLEIGPGLGILTSELATSSACEIILCEKDRILCDYLKGEYKNKKFKVICDDALLLIPNLHVSPPFSVVSNLPYNISSPVIISLLTVCPTLPEKMVLMVQREVADRLIALPHDSNRGILTVLLELFGEVKMIEKVSKGVFYPVPEVDSAVICVSKIVSPPFDAKFALRILKLSFAGKRKKIKNSLFSALKMDNQTMQKVLSKSGLNENMRPEELTRDQWIALIKELA